MKIQFSSPVVGNVKKSSRRLPPTFAFLILYFVKVLPVRASRASCYLKPVTFQQIRFSSSSIEFFPITEDDKKTNRFMVPLFGDGALLTNNINDVKWKMKLGG